MKPKRKRIKSSRVLRAYEKWLRKSWAAHPSSHPLTRSKNLAGASMLSGDQNPWKLLPVMHEVKQLVRLYFKPSSVLARGAELSTYNAQALDLDTFIWGVLQLPKYRHLKSAERVEVKYFVSGTLTFPYYQGVPLRYTIWEPKHPELKEILSSGAPLFKFSRLLHRVQHEVSGATKAD